MVYKYSLYMGEMLYKILFLSNNYNKISIILAARIIRQVVQGLLYLHSHQILHRDMSLSNLLLTKDMQVVHKKKYIYIF